MKKKFIYIVLSLLLAFSLTACKDKKVEHNIKVEEVENTVRWQDIKVAFKITGETEEVKIADNSLVAELYKNSKLVTTRNPGKTSTGYLVSFSSLDVNTEYEVVITASISHRKVELYRATVKTLLEGGSETDPILISSAADFAAIKNADAYYKLTNDIDFNGELIPTPFSTGLKGQFDGAGFALKNFTVPYVTFNGIFGYMTSGSGVVKNLVISDFTYDNYSNIENKTSPSTYYVGLLTRELNASAKIENIKFNNITVNLYTQTYGMRYFGLVTAHNRGTIEGVTLNNVNFNIYYNNANESQVGGVVAKNYSTGKISKVNYASGNFNVLSDEYSTHYSSTFPATYYGTVVGEGSGKLSEVVSNANLNVVLQKPITDKKIVRVDGERFTVYAESIDGGSSVQSFNAVNPTDEVRVEFRTTPKQEIHQVLLNGEDKTLELVNKTLIIPADVAEINVKVTYKSIDETLKVALAGENFKVVSATLGSEVVYDGTGELPTEWTYGTVVKVESTLTSGKLLHIKANGNKLELVNGVGEVELIRDTTINVVHGSTKVLYIGGIGGAISTLENALYLGNLNVDLPREFNMFEDMRIGTLAGTVYSNANRVAAINSTVDVNNEAPQRTIAVTRLVGSLRVSVTIQNHAVVNSTIKVNGLELDDGYENVTALSENLFTSEFVNGLLPQQ